MDLKKKKVEGGHIKFPYYGKTIWAMWSFYALTYILDKQVSLKIKLNLFKNTDGAEGEISNKD